MAMMTNHPSCGVYLAPSSIPGAGIGMYVGNRSLIEGDMVTNEDILIPIVEADWHLPGRFKDTKFLWYEYTWSASTFPDLTEDEIDDLEDLTIASPGVGACANSYIGMVNVEDNSWTIRTSVDLSKDSPGRGAHTSYVGRSFFATEPMVPGQEIFVHYGEDYFTSRTKIYGHIPMSEDFDRADTILDEALSYTFHNQNLNQSSRSSSSIHNETTNTCSSSSSGGEICQTIGDQIWEDLHGFITDLSTTVYPESRILNAVPSDPSIVDELLHDGGTAWQHYNRSVRSLEWLEENGECADHIFPGTSTIPHAGKGAFASRFLPKDTIVSPAPLVHIPDMDRLVMFLDHIYNEDGRLVPNREGRYTWQLMINYCFAHPESTLLLCPYGLLSSLINHSSSSSSSQPPNAKLQWSTHHRHPEWLEKPIEEWADAYHNGLQLDFVATRSILPGEEILIDYGNLWQTSWDHHVREFSSPDYTSSHELNHGLHDYDDYLEGQPGVQLYCRGWYLDQEEDAMCEMVQELSSPSDDRYVVRILEWDEWSSRYNFLYYSWGLPKDAFFFKDLPYGRDIHQEWAFRHPMMIPDEIFPEVWKNRVSPFLEYVHRPEDDDYDEEEEEESDAEDLDEPEESEENLPYLEEDDDDDNLLDHEDQNWNQDDLETIANNE